MKRNTIMAIIITFCFTASLFLIIPIRSARNPYDPNLDTNHDGTINLQELVLLAASYNTGGDPTMNVTITNVIPYPQYYIYSAPFIVSTENSAHPTPEGVGPGTYETCIFVHNPSGTSAVTILKKLVYIMLNESGQTTSIWLTRNYMLIPDGATTVTSEEIWQYHPTAPVFGSPVEGYACIISTSPYLDVNAYYTVSNIGAFNTTSIDSQIITPKPYVSLNTPLP